MLRFSKALLIIGLFGVLLGQPLTARAETYYVDISQTVSSPTGTGSFANAFKHLEEAIQAAGVGPDTIRIAQGEYHPGDVTGVDNTDRGISFVLRPQVVIEGGYKGRVGLPVGGGPDTSNDRDIVNYETILSGDLADNDPTTSDNSYIVVYAGFGELVEDDAELDGLTIEAGYSTGFAFGAGLYVEGGNPASNPSVIDCTFKSNIAGWEGGGVFLAGGNPTNPRTITFTRCKFIENEAGDSGGGLAGEHETEIRANDCHFTANKAHSDGGGAYLGSQNTAFFTGCTFEGNQQLVDSENTGGGAIYLKKNADLDVRHSSFIQNSALGQGGALRKKSGPAEGGGKVVLTDCLFDGNSCENGAPTGGAIYADFVVDPIQIYSCTFRGNFCTTIDEATEGGAIYFEAASKANMMNCVLYNNEADFGAGVFTKAATFSLVNSTLTKNEAAVQGGGLYCDTDEGGTPQIRNSIFWGNFDGISSDVEDEQITYNAAAPNVRFSCIEDDDSEDGSIPFNTGGITSNIDDDPEFVDAVTNDYRLKAEVSPCIETGENDSILDDFGDTDDDSNTGEETPLDIEPLDRVNYCLVDMGAYEFHCAACQMLGDMNGDGLINGADIQAFVDCYLTPRNEQTCECWCGDYLVYYPYKGVGWDDITSFVYCLVGTYPTNYCSDRVCVDPGEPRVSDCNENEVNDDVDIFFGTSTDCNENYIPDECDIAACESDWTCSDQNANSIPDGCEPDCNGNEIPDDVDLAECDSDPACADCNDNGIPDECEADCNANGIPDDCDLDPLDPDGDEWVSADCDGNGIPDECDYDCDENGVPDACDIDPLDPDGDEWVAPDCNGNGQPDGCDIDEGLPFGELDCNENEIPDSCDIANCDPGIDPADCDCNENGSPDGCDIAAEISEDLDENGIPDECEQEMMMMGVGEGGGDGGEGGGEMSEEETEAAREEFYFWCIEQEWGPDSPYTGFEQFERMIEKKKELGL